MKTIGQALDEAIARHKDRYPLDEDVIDSHILALNRECVVVLRTSLFHTGHEYVIPMEEGSDCG
jgi:hypothetical protein